MGGINFDEVGDFSTDIRGFRAKLETIDPDEVAEEAMRETAAELAERVRTTIVAHPDINSPSRGESEYYIGAPSPFDPKGADYMSDAPPLTSKKAWKVDFVADMARVAPVRRVRKRAIILEYGRGAITTEPDNPMRFYVEGAPVFTHRVSDVDAAGYWRTAVRTIRQERVFEDNLEDAMEDELRKAGFT